VTLEVGRRGGGGGNAPLLACRCRVETENDRGHLWGRAINCSPLLGAK